MRERIRQTYTSLEIGLMQEENEQLKRRLEKIINRISLIRMDNDTSIETHRALNELLDIARGEEII